MSVPHSYADAFAITELIQKYPGELLIKVRILLHTVFDYFFPQNHPLLKSVTSYTNESFSDLSNIYTSCFSVNTSSSILI